MFYRILGISQSNWLLLSNICSSFFLPFRFKAFGAVRKNCHPFHHCAKVKAKFFNMIQTNLELFLPLFGYRILGILQSNWLPLSDICSFFKAISFPLSIDFFLPKQKKADQYKVYFVHCSIGFGEFHKHTGFHFPIFALPSKLSVFLLASISFG